MTAGTITGKEWESCVAIVIVIYGGIMKDEGTGGKGNALLLMALVLAMTFLCAAAVSQGGLSFKGAQFLIAAIAAGAAAIVILAARIFRGQLTKKTGAGAGPLPRYSAPGPKPAAEQKPALMLLTLLQEKGRLLDFLMEDIDGYPDAKVCAAARVVHQGCREVIRAAFDPVPITEMEEKGPITLPESYPVEEFMITGTVDRRPPITGKLLHRGWRARKVKLPFATSDSSRVDSPVIVPAQVEV